MAIALRRSAQNAFYDKARQEMRKRCSRGWISRVFCWQVWTARGVQVVEARSGVGSKAVMCPYVKAPSLQEESSGSWFRLVVRSYVRPCLGGTFAAGQDGFRERRPNRPSAPMALGHMRVFAVAAHGEPSSRCTLPTKPLFFCRPAVVRPQSAWFRARPRLGT